MSRVVVCAQMFFICLVPFFTLAITQRPATPTQPDQSLAAAAPLPPSDPSGAAMQPSVAAVAPQPASGTTELARPRRAVISPVETRDDIARVIREQAVVVDRVPGAGPHMPGTLVAQTARLDLYVGTKTFDEAQIAALSSQIEQLLRNDEARLGTTLDHRVSLGFYRPALAPFKGVRGMAYTDQHRAELFYDTGEDMQRAATVVAHELGHHLEAQRYGDDVQRRADTMLHEGLATWLVGERWFGRYGARSWRDRARQIHAKGLPRQLLTAEESCGANNAYELWASFTDFLIQRYGWEKFDELYRSGQGRAPGSSNYERVLGTSLEDVANEWRAWVDE